MKKKSSLKVSDSAIVLEEKFTKTSGKSKKSASKSAGKKLNESSVKKSAKKPTADNNNGVKSAKASTAKNNGATPKLDQVKAKLLKSAGQSNSKVSVKSNVATKGIKEEPQVSGKKRDLKSAVKSQASASAAVKKVANDPDAFKNILASLEAAGGATSAKP